MPSPTRTAFPRSEEDRGSPERWDLAKEGFPRPSPRVVKALLDGPVRIKQLQIPYQRRTRLCQRGKEHVRRESRICVAKCEFGEQPILGDLGVSRRLECHVLAQQCLRLFCRPSVLRQQNCARALAYATGPNRSKTHFAVLVLTPEGTEERRLHPQ